MHVNTQNGKDYINLSTEDSLRDIRKKAGLSQKAAAESLGISLRSYQSYEGDESTCPETKIVAIKKILLEPTLIDEEKGILTIEQIKRVVYGVCKDKDVETVILFGSYAKGTPRENSDVDLFVEGNLNGLDYFGLVEELRVALHKVVDLLTMDSNLENKELLSEVFRYGIRVYVKVDSTEK